VPQCTIAIETKENFHDLRCDALMASPTDVRTLSKYIVRAFIPVYICIRIVKIRQKNRSYSPKK